MNERSLIYCCRDNYLSAGLTGKKVMIRETTEQRAKATMWLWIVLAFGLLAAVVVLLSKVEDTADVARSKTATPLQPVSARVVNVADTEASIEVWAEVRPRWSAEIRATVGGHVIEVSNAALAGQRVDTGTTLFQIERIHYETAVATGELALSEAQLALLRAQNKTTLAQKRFERDGIEPPNELALHLPELRIAESGVASAEAQLRAAVRQLDETTVTAPFSGFVTNRMISLGQTVAAGEPMVTLVDGTMFELTLEVSRENWALLDHPISGQTTRIEDMAGNLLGTATVREGGGFLDPQTRQYRIFLEVAGGENQAILSGDFVRVVLSGRMFPNTLNVPETALTREGHMWFIDPDNRLVRLSPDIIFRRADHIVIHAPNGDAPWRLAVTPLASFLPGQLVAPRIAGDG
ncbi:hypothetical protein GCM10007927_27580 [Sulfitobacter pacificus]|uniref:Multidrug resistance protein MdtA-like barrel-sandwich hybrid domain-containing protein n=2 Tax=Sulfitobacter pacificus TaxID=1499314 RepID=A0ABQ5VLE7_9RHOB|nr:hypothetical protein GCM10007927_27580 [Sulfitobacter pacificus]